MRISEQNGDRWKGDKDVATLTFFIEQLTLTYSLNN
jgi:hypothetical protein